MIKPVKNKPTYMKTKSSFLLLYVLSVLTCLIGIGAYTSAFAGASTYSGITLSRTGYDYAPSVMYGDGPEIKMWWCGSGTIGDEIFYSRLTTSGWTQPQTVLKPSASGWDSQHVCDPSVVKGLFNIGGVNYTYAMYYTATYDTIGYDSHIGVAFSNNGTNWIKYAGNPIIAPARNASSQYGAGVPTAYRASGTNSNVTLVFFDTTGPANNVFKVESLNGVNFGARTQLPNPFGGTAIGDIVFSPSEKSWYVTTNSTTSQEIYIFKTANSLLTGPWLEWGGRINNIVTANLKNHNPAFMRLPNGDIYIRPGTRYKFVYFGTGSSVASSWNIGEVKFMDGWFFDVNGNTEGWVASNVSYNFGPSGGDWVVTAYGNDPWWLSPKISMQPVNFPKIEVIMANQNINTSGRIYFQTNAENFLAKTRVLASP